jgi:hypothetical protein
VNGSGDFLELVVVGSGLWVPLMALFGSHGISMYLNTFRTVFPAPSPVASTAVEKEVPGSAAVVELASNLRDLMTAPYRRIVVLHVALILGAMLGVLFRSHGAAFILLIVLKTGVDAAAHSRKHTKVAPSP